MANTLRFKRGLTAGLPASVAGEPLFTTDTFDLYIGNGTTNTRFQKYIASGTTLQYLRGDGTLATFPILTGFVPYTGATANVDLGTHTILAQNATFASNGSGNTATITHASGSGIALNITKGGNGEGLYINKTSGSGNAATILGTLNATTLVKSGGLSTEYLKADGSVSTLTNPITGTGTAGIIAYWTGASTQSFANQLYWDNSLSRLGVNVPIPTERLHISGNFKIDSGLMTMNNSINAVRGITITNTLAGSSAQSRIELVSDTTAGQGSVIKVSSSYSVYKIVAASDYSLYNATSGDISVLNDWASGNIKFAAGGSSTAHFTIASTGAATFSSSVTAASALLSSGGNGLSLAPGAIGFNRNVLTGTILNSGGFAYQWNKTNSTTNTSDFLDLQVYNTSGTFVTNAIRFDGSGAANFGTSIQAATAIAIGTTPDTNKPFKILKNINAGVGINFENTSTGNLAFSLIQMGRDVTGGTAFTNLVYASSGITESGVFKPNGTSLVNTGSGGLNFLAVSQPIRFFTSSGNGTLRAEIANDGFINHFTGTAPSTNATDGYRQYSADVVAGNAAPHFRTENGAVVKLYQETTAVGNAIISLGGGSSVLDDTTFDGYTLRQIVKALRNQGILA